MEVIVIERKQFDELLIKLNELCRHINFEQPTSERFIDNYDFLKLMKVSKRTAQTWRQQGLISYSAIGSKVYYKISDVDALLKKSYVKGFITKAEYQE